MAVSSDGEEQSRPTAEVREATAVERAREMSREVQPGPAQPHPLYGYNCSGRSCSPWPDSPQDHEDRLTLVNNRARASTATITRLLASQAIGSAGVRNLNINLLTPFPRSMRINLFKATTGLMALGGYVALALLVGWLVWGLVGLVGLVAFILMWVWVLIFLVAGVVPLPRSGEAYQYVRQIVGARGWAVDFYEVATSQRVGFGLVALLSYASGTVLGVGACWLIGKISGGWWIEVIAVVIGLVAFVATAWLVVPYLDRRARELGRDAFKPLPDQVKRLSMVHALSWTMLPKFSTVNHPKGGRFRPLIFVSTFNEGNDGYVGGFVEAFGDRLAGAWGLSPRFPKYRGRSDRRGKVSQANDDSLLALERGFIPYLEFVERTENPLIHSYTAYPHLSAVDLRNALQIDREWRAFQIERIVESNVAGFSLPVTLPQYRRFLRRVRHALPSIPAARDELNVDMPSGLDSPAADPTMTAGRNETSILVSVMPFADNAPKGASNAVRAAIQADLSQDPAIFAGEPALSGTDASRYSLFNLVAGTHLARLSVIDYLPSKDDQGFPGARRPLHLEDHELAMMNDEHQPRQRFLVLAAHIDGNPRAWLRELYTVFRAQITAMVNPADPIRSIAEAMGYPDPADEPIFTDFVLSHRREPLVRQVDHRDLTVWDIMRSVNSHHRLSDALLNNPGNIQRLLDPLLPYRM